LTSTLPSHIWPVDNAFLLCLQNIPRIHHLHRIPLIQDTMISLLTAVMASVSLPAPVLSFLESLLNRVSAGRKDMPLCLEAFNGSPLPWESRSPRARQGLCSPAGSHQLLTFPTLPAPKQASLWLSLLQPHGPPCSPSTHGWFQTTILQAPFTSLCWTPSFLGFFSYLAGAFGCFLRSFKTLNIWAHPHSHFVGNSTRHRIWDGRHFLSELERFPILRPETPCYSDPRFLLFFLLKSFRICSLSSVLWDFMTTSFVPFFMVRLVPQQSLRC
jgi:hypothetical protein